MDDPFQLMEEVFLLNCDGRFDLVRKNGFQWVSQNEIPSNCSTLRITGIDKNGTGYSYEQYKNDRFEAALSGEIIISAENDIELKSIYLSRKIRGETCDAQIERHRRREAEALKKFGPEFNLPKDYEIVPLKNKE